MGSAIITTRNFNEDLASFERHLNDEDLCFSELKSIAETANALDIDNDDCERNQLLARFFDTNAKMEHHGRQARLKVAAIFRDYVHTGDASEEQIDTAKKLSERYEQQHANILEFAYSEEGMKLYEAMSSWCPEHVRSQVSSS